MRREHGFTLIELLIVVAIIGILAAIAMPHLQHAKNRAKISAAKANMKTIANALEMYRLDYGTYFPGGTSRASQEEPHTLWPLTTPIAYLNTIPLDPFRQKDYYTHGASGPETSDWTEQIDYVSYSAEGILWTVGYLRPISDWMLVSIGPDHDTDVKFLEFGPNKEDAYTLMLYMVSNGLHSSGDLLHTSWLSMQF